MYTSNMLFFKISINDTYNAAIVGSTILHCNINSCDIPIIKSNT